MLMIGGAVAAGFGVNAAANVANMIQGAIVNGYSRSLENQADRIGLEYMLNAGYDIREAPRVWKFMSIKYGDQPTNFFWSSHDSNTVRRSYLMAELKNNFSDVDYATLQKGDDAYTRTQQAVRDASKRKQKVKVKY